MGGVLVGLLDVAAAIRVAVTVIPLIVPRTRTMLPTGNCCAVADVRLAPNCGGVMPPPVPASNLAT